MPTQETLEPRSETLLGKWLADLATAEEAAELRNAAEGNEALRQAMELLEQSVDCVRHSSLGEAAMIDRTLPPFTRPQQLAQTLERLHASRRRLLVLSLGVMVTVVAVIALISGPGALWAPDSLFSALGGGILLAALVLHLRREDPVWQLSRLDKLQGGESWLDEVRRIERTRQRYASRGALYVAAGVLLLGVATEIIGTVVGTPLSLSAGKFVFLGSIFIAAFIWLRHREFVKLPSID
jgi:hypothetical protein